MTKVSAGLIMFRRRPGGIEILLVHPGGPFWARKDAGAWSIPKGEVESGEGLLSAARREFKEELGLEAAGPFIELSPIKQKGGKVVRAWAFEGDCDTTSIRSNSFTMEWPPKSGKQAEFPEIDRAGFFAPDEAKKKVNPAQAGLIDQLEKEGQIPMALP